MGVNAMRFLTIAAAATLLMLPAVAPATACELDAIAAEAQAPVLVAAAPVTQELSAEEKKMDDKKPMKKTAKKRSKKMKKEKVEYMRAAPMK
jgi:hypothetical protein